MNKKGFTLIELMIVIAIIAIVAGVAIPALMGIKETHTGKTASEEIKDAVNSGIKISASAAVKFKNEMKKAESGEDDNDSPSMPQITIDCIEESVLESSCTYTIVHVGQAYRIPMSCISGLGGYDCTLTQ